MRSGTNHVNQLNDIYRDYDNSTYNYSYRYRFEYDSQQEQLYLCKPKETFWIINDTKRPVEYIVQWWYTAELTEYADEHHILQPGEKRAHWQPSYIQAVPKYYPKISFLNIDKGYTTKSSIKTAEEFFSLDVTEGAYFSVDVKDAQEKNSPKSDNQYYFSLEFDEKGKESLQFYSGVPLEAKNGVLTFIKNNWKQILFAFSFLIGVILFLIGCLLYKNGVVKKHYHVYSIQNNTEATVEYQVKWKEKDDWETDSLETGESATAMYQDKSIEEGYPKVRFETTINDQQETQEQVLGTYVRRFWREGAIGRKHARQYHFERDSETDALKLVDSEQDDE